MNKWLQSTLGVSAAALMVLLASNGKALVEALEAAWLFLMKLVETAPMGLASFAMALTMAVLAQGFIARLADQLKCASSREVVKSAVSLLFGFAVMYLQLPTVKGALLGLLAGFAGPFAFQAVAALCGLIRPRKSEAVNGPE